MENEADGAPQRRIFEDCLRRPREAQSQYIREACAGKAELEQRIQRLLAAHRKAEGPTRLGFGLLPEEDEERDPRNVGPYRILSRIGKGGMGVVYKAEQLRPVRRVVAVKLIKRGLDTQEFIARFESERQALALMNHPNIAGILEAGATSEGRPYFVMECVGGEPITTFCDRRRLTIQERVRLFIDVCEAVQHAHQKGIIHRDLKPSNILVTVSGETPVAKVIDFGVAKATGFRLTEKTIHTRLGMLVGTPEYMSPEQAEATGLDIDTRSDVYSLGVVLYELLAGTRPLDCGNEALAEISRVVREVEPLRPSLKALQQDDPQRAARDRRTDSKSLARRLRGDLDWILMRTLEKDRIRRFPTASGLAADLRRHLASEPVSSGPPGAAYRLGKFARRHRRSLLAAFVLLAVLVGGVIGTSTGLLRARSQARQARLQADIARAVNDFLNQDILAAVDPQHQGIDVTMREVLEAASARIEEKFRGQPLVQAAVHGTIGRTFGSLGELTKAEQHLKKAMRLRRQHQGAGHSDTVSAMNRLAGLYFDQGRLEESADLSREAFETGKSALGDLHKDTLAASLRLGMVYSRLARYDEAEESLLKSLKSKEEILDEADSGTLATLVSLGNFHWSQRDYDRASQRYREALAHLRAALGEEHPQTLTCMANLGLALQAMGRHGDAQAILSETLGIRRRVQGSDHPRTIATLALLAFNHWQRGRYDAARDLFEQVYQQRRVRLGAEHGDTLMALTNLGMVSLALGRLEEADDCLSRSLKGHRRRLGSDHWRTMKTARGLGNLRSRQNRYAEASRLLEESLQQLRRSLGEGHLETFLTRTGLARLRNLESRHKEARSLSRQALGRVHLRSADRWHLDAARIQLGVALTALREYEEAEDVLLQAHRGLEASRGGGDHWTQEAVRALVGLNHAQGRPAEKALWTSRLDP